MISSIILYFFQTAICLTFFCVLYCLFLRKETFFKSNRLFLLFTLLASVLIPIFEFSFNLGFNSSHEQMFTNAVVASQEFLNTKMLKEVVVVASGDNFVLMQAILVIYVIGVLFLVIRFVYNISLLFIWINFNKRDEDVIILKNDYPPFSFLNYIFINKKDILCEDVNSILEHEKVHVKQLHTLDILLIEIISIIMWINPIVWFYKSFLHEVHEYLADNRVVQSDIDEGEYKKHIVNRIVGGDIFEIANNFGHSSLKRRIMMLGKMKSSRLAFLKFLLLFPVSFFLISAFTFSIEKQNIFKLADNYKILDFTEFFNISNDLYYTEDYPIDKFNNLSIYEGISNLEYKTSLNQEENFNTTFTESIYPGGIEALNVYIKENLKYPIDAFKNNIKGRVYVNFRVNTIGQIDNVRINKSVSDELDSEALRLILNMKKWIPAEKNGNPISVAYTIPVDFEILYEKTKPIECKLMASLVEKPLITIKLADCIDDKVYTRVDTYPEFKGGHKALERYVSRNVKYPNLAIDQAYQGRVYVNFVVNKYGKIISPSIKQGVNVEIDNEALRLIKKMPNWIPGVLNGKPVSVDYTLPILFKLQ